MDATTYSFAEVTFVISHPLLGQSITDGIGIGKITTSYMDDNTQSDLGADGQVMVSKVETHRGTISLDIQQTSGLNKWLINAVNVLRNADASNWAGMTITITEKFDNGVTTTGSQAAFVKRPDRELGPNGTHVAWQFFCPQLTQI